MSTDTDMTIDQPASSVNTAADAVIVRSVEISAPASQVWHALTDPAMIAQWMLGTQTESSWEENSPIAYTNTLHGITYHDRGTVLAMIPERLLKYSHWSDLSRLPDEPQNRTIVTLTLEPVVGETRLSVRHEQFYSGDAYGHANFFWGYALRDVKNLVENRPI